MTDNIFQIIISWLKIRPIWIQEAFKRLVNQQEITSNDITDLLALCKKEAGIPTTYKPQTSTDHLDTLFPKTVKKNLRLVSISNVSGINALAPKKPLNFGNEPLVIIYGLNGAGKSGYVRVMKHAFGGKGCCTLFPNVFDPQNKIPSCTFSYDSDGEQKPIDWNENKGIIKELSEIEIYDTDSADIYINEENEVAYEPSVLRLFSIITNIAIQLNELLKKEIESNTSQLPSMPIEYNGTGLYSFFNSISYSTSLAEIDKKCLWDEKKQEELDSMSKRLLEKNPEDKAIEYRNKEKNTVSLKSILDKIYENLSDINSQKYLELKKNVSNKRKASEIFAVQLQKKSLLPGIGSEVWKLLWEQARKYSVEIAYPDVEFPNTGDNARCVLCQQELKDDDVKKRFISFEEFVTGNLESDAKLAETERQNFEDSLNNYPEKEELERYLDAAGIPENGKIEIKEFVNNLKTRKLKLLSVKKASELPAISDQKTIEKIDIWKDKMGKTASEFEEDAKGHNRDELEKSKLELVLCQLDNVG